jgi:hypothetical protein
VVFRAVTPCSDVVGYQCFGGPCCLHLQGEDGVTMQRTTNWIFISVKTSNQLYVSRLCFVWASHSRRNVSILLRYSGGPGFECLLSDRPSDSGVSGFPGGTCWDSILKWVTTTSFHVLSSSPWKYCHSMECNQCSCVFIFVVSLMLLSVWSGNFLIVWMCRLTVCVKAFNCQGHSYLHRRKLFTCDN